MFLERTREERQARLNESRLHVFDLKPLTDALWTEPETGEKSGRSGVTLVKTPDLRVVLEVLERGASLAEHRAPGPITVQVLEGEIRFAAGEEIVYLRAGELVALPDTQLHSVEAVRDSSLLLTIAPKNALAAL